MTLNHAELTGNDNYFEDFIVGDVYQHMRGKTIFPSENVCITNMVMNTATGHFNAHQMESVPYGGGRVVSYGGVNFSLVLGLAAQDCIENALEELGLDNIKLTKPVVHGDTLYAYTEVLSKSDSEREDAGIVVFRHYGVNQRNQLVAQLDRRALIKRRQYWLK
jgi:acyl dehydratase